MVPILALGAVLAAQATSPSELTIYNGGFALVKQRRTLNLTQGIGNVTVEDVAQQIEANSVGVKALGDANDFSILEQNYKYDLIGVNAILEKSVGQHLLLKRDLPGGKVEELSGTLLSAPQTVVSDENGNQSTVYNGMVFRTDEGQIILNPTGTVYVDHMPEGLVSKPSLVWLLDSQKSGPEDVELSYLTQGMNWKSDYVLSLDSDGKRGDIKGWVTINNHSGTTYKDAKLTLLAGEVNRAPKPVMYRKAAMMDMAAGSAKAPAMVEETFGDYHLYTVTHPATVANNEIKQVSLLDGSDIHVTKKLLIDAMGDYSDYYPSEGEVGTGNIKPVIYIELENKKENNLGIPLPEGDFKVFQRTKSGSLELLGEDHITHTPKNEKLSLKIGQAFDIVATRKRMKYTRINDRTFEETFSVELRNRKDTEETVTVWERHWGDHKIMDENMDSTWLDATTLQYIVPLKPNEVKTINYTIRTKW